VFTAKLSSQASKYSSTLDKATQKRLKAKITELCKDPFDIRLSKPLKESIKRTARVGGYRILFIVHGDILLVSDIGPRGKIYREA